MARLTITLPDSLHRALKEASAKRGRPMGELIEESLRFYGIKSTEDALEILRRAQRQAGLEPEAALEMAVEETRAQRER